MQSIDSTLNGLVLAGGKSSRMGEDKSMVQWHGKEQRYYVADMLTNFCKNVFVSCRKEQSYTIDKHYEIIEDEVEDKGPLGAIVSAFHQTNNCGWLVVASDLPLLDKKTIQYLVQHRDENFIASAFKNKDGLPEPLIAIWEPAALTLLETALSEGKLSPQKILMKATTNFLSLADPTALMNVNTPEEKEIALQLIKN